MTSNQVQNRANVEQARANRERERETRRSNRAREGQVDRANKETERHNRKQERQATFDTVVKGVTSAVGNISKMNDPSWYNMDKQLVDDVARIPFGAANGIVVDVAGYREKFPGVMVLRWRPYAGPYKSANVHPINIAARNIYAFVRHANSGSRNYEAPDLMMYFFAMDSAYSYFAEISRVYSIALSAKGENRYMGVGLLRAMGYNAEDIIGNLASLRQALNVFGTQLNSFYVPSSLPLFNRHIWMAQSIFQDQPVKKSQYMVYAMSGCWLFNENGYLNYTQLPQTGVKYSTIQGIFNQIIESLLPNEDIGIMSGDILKAYGENDLFFIKSVEDQFHIESTYSEEVLSQINGVTILGDPYVSAGHAAVVYQNTNNGLIYEAEVDISDPVNPKFVGALNNFAPTWGSYDSALSMSKVIETLPETAYTHHFVNMYKDDVKPDDVMVATRLTALPTEMVGVDGGETSGLSGIKCSNVQAGSEIITKVMLACFNPNTNAVDLTSIPSTWRIVNKSQAQDGQDVLNMLALFSKFDWHPALKMYSGLDLGSGNLSLSYIGLFADIANWAQIDAEQLEAMHEVALLSEFAVPKLGMKVRAR